MHRVITWILAGSHQITKLPHAPRTSYLVIEVPLFTLAETRLLLAAASKYSTLWPPDSPSRPGFDFGVGIEESGGCFEKVSTC